MKSTVLNLNPFDLMVHAFNLLASNIISTLICEIFKVENDCFKRIFSKFLKSFLLLFFFPFHSFQFLFLPFIFLLCQHEFTALEIYYFQDDISLITLSVVTTIFKLLDSNSWYIHAHVHGSNWEDVDTNEKM